jgi:hypothetical protein
VLVDGSAGDGARRAVDLSSAIPEPMAG